MYLVQKSYYLVFENVYWKTANGQFLKSKQYNAENVRGCISSIPPSCN